MSKSMVTKNVCGVVSVLLVMSAEGCASKMPLSHHAASSESQEGKYEKVYGGGETMTKSYRRIVDQELDKNAQPIIDVAREVIRALGIVVDYEDRPHIHWESDNDQGDPPFYPRLDVGFRQATKVEVGPQVTENVKEALLKLPGFKVPEHVYSHSSWLQKGDVRIELPRYYPPDDTAVSQGEYGLEFYGPANVTADLNKYFYVDSPEYGADYSPILGHDVDLK